MNKYLLIFVLGMAVFGAAPFKVYAVGIQVSPTRLEISQQTPSELRVFNPTADVMVFEAYVEEFGQTIDIMPKSFTLESGASKAIKLKFSGTYQEVQNSTLSTNLAIVATPLSPSQVQLGAGVKVPITFTTYSSGRTDNAYRNMLTGLAAVSLLLAAWVLQKKVLR